MGGRKGLVAFNTELGNYKIKKNPDFEYNNGDMAEFFCPICHQNLAAFDVDVHLAKVILQEQSGKNYEILFSSIAGEHCTYKVLDGSVKETFGEDNAHYINHFGEEPRY